MTEISVDGATLHVEEQGSPTDPVLLLIHAGVATLRMWDPQIAALAEGHRVIRYDTRGFGRSPATTAPFSDYLDAVAVLDQLGVESATAIGCSRGGNIAIDLAVARPDRVRGLVTIGSGAGGQPEIADTEIETAIFAEIERLEQKGGWEEAIRLEVKLWDVGPLRDPATVDPAFVELATSLALDNLELAPTRPAPRHLDPPAWGRLADLRIPSLFMVGDYDLNWALRSYDNLMEAVPGAEGIRFDDAAHLPSVERPDVFERALTRWLSHHGL